MEEACAVVAEALRASPAGERRFLVLVPDSTRKAPVADVFRAIHDAVEGRADRVDAMIAQGTHGPMSEAEKTAWVFGQEPLSPQHRLRPRLGQPGGPYAPGRGPAGRSVGPLR